MRTLPVRTQALVQSVANGHEAQAAKAGRDPLTPRRKEQLLSARLSATRLAQSWHLQTQWQQPQLALRQALQPAMPSFASCYLVQQVLERRKDPHIPVSADSTK